MATLAATRRAVLRLKHDGEPEIEFDRTGKHTERSSGCEQSQTITFGTVVFRLLKKRDSAEKASLRCESSRIFINKFEKG